MNKKMHYEIFPLITAIYKEAGKTKTIQNYISVTYPNWHVETVFTPLNPTDKPIALENICNEYNRVIGTRK